MLFMASDGRRRRQAGRAMAQMRGTDALKCFDSAIHEVMSRAAVDMQIDETGREIGAREIKDGFVVRGTFALPDCTDAAMFDMEPTIFQQAIRINEGGVGEVHWFSSSMAARSASKGKFVIHSPQRKQGRNGDLGASTPRPCSRCGLRGSGRISRGLFYCYNDD